MKDLFEDTRLALGLSYVSDICLWTNKKRVIAALKQLDLKEYPLFALSDMANYLAEHKRPFTDYESAISFFEKLDS